MNFRDIIRKIKYEKDIRIKDISAQTGITKTTIYEWMSGSQYPQRGKLKHFITYYDLDYKEVYRAMAETQISYYDDECE